MLLDNQRIKEEIEKGLKKGYFKANKNANITPKLNGIQLLEEVHSEKCLERN